MDVKEEYGRILDQLKKGSVAFKQGSHAERRKHPRLKANSKDLWISTVPEFELVDISASGVAVRSNHPILPGETINFSLGKSLTVDMVVVACQMDQSPDEYTDGEFRIQCRFLEDLRGMELFIRAIREN